MNIIISNASELPIYEQIAGQIKNLIIKGELKGDDLLPSIRNLAKELKISVITTKRAYEELEKDGFIVSVPGKGCYVAAQNRELIKESRLRLVEEKVEEVVETAKTAGLSKKELMEMIELFYEGGV
ncbi:MAG: GntR family transcriptional regulator [Clostridia bacterium]|nr:GntR family transcriptional regulator [Clostridiaceae bacterium]